jgi:hypothetical protein
MSTLTEIRCEWMAGMQVPFIRSTKGNHDQHMKQVQITTRLVAMAISKLISLFHVLQLKRAHKHDDTLPMYSNLLGMHTLVCIHCPHA